LGRIHTAGVANVDWKGFDEGYGRRRVRELPNYPFQREKYWLTAGAGGGDAAGIESMRINSKLLHPLLGRRVPSPTAQLISYYNSIRLTSSSLLSYVMEHKVSDVVILPAVGYLEMVLAAGCDMIGGYFSANQRIPLSVRSLVVESALAFTEEEGSTQLQTTVTAKEGVGVAADDGETEYEVTIYKQTVFDGSGSGTGTWKKLASAIFVP
jgi:acyl transferase domain-containing protein